MRRRALASARFTLRAAPGRFSSPTSHQTQRLERAGIKSQATRITKKPYGALGGVREPQQSDSTADVPCMEKSLETFTDHQ